MLSKKIVLKLIMDKISMDYGFMLNDGCIVHACFQSDD
jgi:hypothetical protein